MNPAIAPLAEAELYQRLDRLVPGDEPPGGAVLQIDRELYFERMSLDGLEDMHRYSVDERLYEFFEYRPFVTIGETKAYIEKQLRSMGQETHGRTAMCWFVRRKSDDYLVGTARLVNLSYLRQSVEWGYGIDPALWGRGYILQIQGMLKQYVFEILRLNRLSGVTMLENRRTISSLLAAGMQHEGTLRSHYCKDGTHHDGWAYSMLAQDYYRLKEPASRSVPACTVEDVIEILSSVLGESEIGALSTMRNTNNWDSLNHMLIMVAISEKTGIILSPAEIARATSLQAILSMINNGR